jgi:hypothetical protein
LYGFLDRSLRELRLLEEQVRKAKTRGVAPLCVRTYTPEDVKSWLPALAPPTALTNVYEYSKMAALKELRMFAGPLRIPWLWLILLGVLLLIAVVALPHLQSIVQGGAQAVGQAVPTVPPPGWAEITTYHPDYIMLLARLFEDACHARAAAEVSGTYEAIRYLHTASVYLKQIYYIAPPQVKSHVNSRLQELIGDGTTISTYFEHLGRACDSIQTLDMRARDKQELCNRNPYNGIERCV